MEIEDVRNRLRETEGDCFLDLPRQIGNLPRQIWKTAELAKFAIEEEEKGKCILFVCVNRETKESVENIIFEYANRTINIHVKMENEVGSVTGRYDIAIFDEFTHMSRDNINYCRWFCGRLVGLGTSTIMEEMIRENNTTDREEALDDVRLNYSGRDSFSETDKYLFRLGIFNYLEKIETNQEDRLNGESLEVGQQEESMSMEDIDHIIWSIM